VNGAMILSILFLLCYVAYHFTQVETLFGDFNKDGIVSGEEKAQSGGTRTAYLVILLTHIAFAAISLPLILFTWVFAVTNQFKKHRKFAVITYPMWLYVAVTGPVCYFMLKPFY
jgi:putative membrane protein